MSLESILNAVCRMEWIVADARYCGERCATCGQTCYKARILKHGVDKCASKYVSRLVEA